jgi:hypothetical protein
MTIKIPKAEAVERIASLLALDLSYRAIGQRIGLSAGRVCQIIKDHGLPKRRLTIVLANETETTDPRNSGELRPKES